MNEIKWVAAKGKFCHVFTENSSKLPYRKTLGELHSELGENFIRIHKSYLIHKTKMQEIEIGKGGKYFVILSSGEKIPLSRKVYKELITKNKFIF